MSRIECDRIFSELIPKSVSEASRVAQWMADLHTDVQVHFSSASSGRDTSRGEAAMTLRNFNSAIAIIEIGKFNAQDACDIAYMAQLPRNLRKSFEKRMVPPLL
jgi:hypothetical protein